MRRFVEGDWVIKNPDTWQANAFDDWGRGLGVGLVVEAPFPMTCDECDVIWPHGRCFENGAGLLSVPPGEDVIGAGPCDTLAESVIRRPVRRVRRSRHPGGCVVCLDGNIISVSMMDGVTRRLLSDHGYSGTGRDVQKTTSNDTVKAADMLFLRASGLPFARGKEWSSAEVFELFRERALISGPYLAMSWLSPAAYQIEER
jgi:hypothetical protein